MNRACIAGLALILLFVAKMCVASDQLVWVPYDPQTDLPKLVGDLGLNQERVVFHSRCAYIHLNEWAPSVKLESIHLCVVALTHDQLILAIWKAESSSYAPTFKLDYSDITRAALSVEGTKYQLQLTTPQGLLAITTTKYRAQPPGDSSDAATILKHLSAKGVAVADSPGRVDLEKRLFILLPGKKR